jgi:SAM-dependent methyltransferase
MNALHNEAAEAIAAGYSSGGTSPEMALMGLLIELHTPDAVIAWLAGRGHDELLRLAEAHRSDMAGVTAVIEAGLIAGHSGGLAGIRALFDRSAAISPVAAVALYSLGSPAILARATDEIVERLCAWGLVGTEIAVLDIGCGIGRVERSLAPYAGRILGIDLSPAMVAEARRRCAGLANVELAVCSGTDLGALAGRRFGLVLAVDSFPYLIAADPAIAERHIADAARLLDPGGALAIFNYSYREDLALDRADVARLATRNGLVVERNGARDFSLWDGASFLLRRPAQ